MSFTSIFKVLAHLIHLQEEYDCQEDVQKHKTLNEQDNHEHSKEYIDYLSKRKKKDCSRTYRIISTLLQASQEDSVRYRPPQLLMNIWGSTCNARMKNSSTCLHMNEKIHGRTENPEPAREIEQQQ